MQFGYNTAATDFLIDTTYLGRFPRNEGETASNWIIRYFQSIDARVTKYGFKQNLLAAIAKDSIAEDHGDRYAEAYIRRLSKWCRKKDQKKHLYRKTDILDSLNIDRVKIVPDGHLIDVKKKTVVCYELEDKHPLNDNSIAKYSKLWWALEYIYWDLHLIAYDVWGNHRIIKFPFTTFAAQELDR